MADKPRGDIHIHIGSDLLNGKSGVANSPPKDESTGILPTQDPATKPQDKDTNLGAKVKARVLNKTKPVPGIEDAYWKDNFNTQLNPEQEGQFQGWLKEASAARGRDLSKDLQNYDVRGFWKHNDRRNSSGHGPDTFKKPNHITFSDESIYHGNKSPFGGKFEGGKWIDMGGGVTTRGAGMGLHDDTTRTGEPRKNWVFHPSDTMMNTTHKDVGALQDYFKKYEKDVHLVLPFSLHKKK